MPDMMNVLTRPTYPKPILTLLLAAVTVQAVLGGASLPVSTARAARGLLGSAPVPLTDTLRVELERAILDATVMIAFVHELELEGAPENQLLLVRDLEPSGLGTVVAPRVVITHGHPDLDLRVRYRGTLRRARLREVMLYNAEGAPLGSYEVGSDVEVDHRPERIRLTFAELVPGVTPLPLWTGAEAALATDDELAVAVLRNGRAVVVRARVLTVANGRLIYDYPVRPGDSGGAVVHEGHHVATTWSRIEGSIRRCTAPPCTGPGRPLVAGVAALN